MVYENGYDKPEENVLKYIYKLKEHLENLKLLWQGLAKNGKGFMRISDPISDDGFIYAQISSLAVVLSPHNFVSQIQSGEKDAIILDTYSAFLSELLKEPFFNWSKFPMVRESYYNTLHLFLNILEGGFGAQLTTAIQSGITSRIHRDEERQEIKPFVDLPQVFGFNKNKQQEIKPQPIQNTDNHEVEE